MGPTRFGVAAFCAATLVFSSGALSQGTNHAASTKGSALPEDTIGGLIYSPDGITHIVGDGMGGGFIFGAQGSSTFISNGMGGATLLNGTDSIISDGMGGLYSPGRMQASPEAANAR